ncbi:MAG: ABC transporter ATP-binding protein [Planctomycetota bacterium]
MSIIYPDSGSVDVLGGNALRSKDRIGYLPEERGLYRKMRVGEFLLFMARLKGVRKPDLAGFVNEWLERLELPGVYRKKCEELSKGMQQKVQFLAAILHDPELLILDEPFSGKTIIFSTHILHQAEQICDRIFLINKGLKLLDATIEEIRQRFDPRTIVAEPLDGQADLDGLRGVREVRRLPDTDRLEFELEDGTNPQKIMKDALASHPMRSIELRRLSLDEVFVRLVRDDEGADAAELAREELSHV